MLSKRLTSDVPFVSWALTNGRVNLFPVYPSG
jgi:hypothetical protein